MSRNDVFHHSPNPADPLRKLSVELHELAQQFAERRVTLQEVMTVLGVRASGLLIIILALPFCAPVSIPGLSVPFGMVILYIAARYALGLAPWLPARLLRTELPPRFFRAVLEGGRPGEVYNVGGDAEKENIEVVQRICDLLDARRPPADGRSRRELITFVADLERTDNAEALTLIAELARKHNDARASVVMGKDAVGRGLPLDHHAFPTYGLPNYSAIGPEVEPAIVYSIARQESAFNPQTVSPANALGLMQVTPAAGRYIAKTYNVRFDQKRLLHDNVYNVQMGAAELGGNIEAYRGSYILAFAAYNAGRGRVQEWIERFGDPRDPNVDPVDWVERIPFSETRNYVQRIMENVQAYRVRFGRGTKLLIEADIRRGSAVN